jgi:hypothetical protein
VLGPLWAARLRLVGKDWREVHGGVFGGFRSGQEGVHGVWGSIEKVARPLFGI